MKNITTFDIFLGTIYSIIFGLYLYCMYLFPLVFCFIFLFLLLATLLIED